MPLWDRCKTCLRVQLVLCEFSLLLDHADHDDVLFSRQDNTSCELWHPSFGFKLGDASRFSQFIEEVVTAKRRDQRLWKEVEGPSGFGVQRYVSERGGWSNMCRSNGHGRISRAPLASPFLTSGVSGHNRPRCRVTLISVRDCFVVTRCDGRNRSHETIGWSHACTLCSGCLECDTGVLK